LREGERAGVLLHGMGRLGKSSLAARIANRRRDLRVAVVFEHYGALVLLSALRIRRKEELPVYERLGEVRSRAVTMGKIADILFSRGDLDEALRIRCTSVWARCARALSPWARSPTGSRGDLDEALRIRREEQLPMFEHLGDVRERAVAMGKIADILTKKGDRVKARSLREDRLQIHRQMDDRDGIANALWDLSQLDLAEQKTGDAIPRIIVAYAIVERLGRAQGIAVIGTVFGQILAAQGEPDVARRVLQRSAEMYRVMGLTNDAQAVEELIRKLRLD
jgi:hypothetical protein